MLRFLRRVKCKILFNQIKMYAYLQKVTEGMTVASHQPSNEMEATLRYAMALVVCLVLFQVTDVVQEGYASSSNCLEKPLIQSQVSSMVHMMASLVWDFLKPRLIKYQLFLIIYSNKSLQINPRFHSGSTGKLKLL